MGYLQSPWDINDFVNARDAVFSESQWVHFQVIFRKFLGYELMNPDRTPLEQYNVPQYATRAEHVWLSSVKVFDTVKGGYFTTGDLDVNSFFKIQGYAPAEVLPTGVKISEYAGDQIIWNGKVWVLSDQIEPVQFGIIPGTVYWRSVLRAVDRSSQGTTPGSK